ncbi:MAG: ABC transporter permease [Eubacteriales bacterium]|nr:ABC transporter permease [Eubacteriales bacterium]
MSKGKSIGKRLLQLIPIILGLTFLTFLLMYITPGDPAVKKLAAQGTAINGEVLEQTREAMGLNRPFLVRYLDWLLGMLRGDFGLSYKDNLPVAAKLVSGLGNTALLALTSLALSLLVSIPAGIVTAVRKDGILDHVLRLFSFLGNSLPNFLISVILMYVLCIRMKLLPVIANRSLKGLCLPCLALAIPMTGRFIRQIRAEVLEQLGKPYVMGARMRGVRERDVLFKNVLRSAWVGIFTIVGLSVGTLMGGSVVIETIFGWPGLGKLAMDAISDRDYPVIQGFVVLMAVIYVLVNLLTDLSYRWIDPRMDGE